MKPFIAVYLLLLGSLTIYAQPELPPEIIVDNEPVGLNEFKVWFEQNPMKYSGSYAGEPGGDTEATITIKVTRNVTENHVESVPFVVSGIYTQKIAGCIPQIVNFKDAHYYSDSDSRGVISAGAFEIFFVTYGKRHGVIIGNSFFKRES